VNAGVWPSSGSITSDVWRYDFVFHAPSLRNAPIAFSPASRRFSSAFSASANSWSFRNGRLPYFAGRSRGMPSAASLVHTPEMSGSPHGVFGCTKPLAGFASSAEICAVVSLSPLDWPNTDADVRPRPAARTAALENQ